MKKRVIKIAALVVLFAAVLVISNVIQNRGNDDHLVDMADAKKHFAEISGEMDALGEKIGVSIKCQREEIFEKMHRV